MAVPAATCEVRLAGRLVRPSGVLEAGQPRGICARMVGVARTACSDDQRTWLHEEVRWSG
ncbi:MAG: hypothetical protein DLM57_02985 [Pseudonocardiales bacterium]|nr:MAG: hypothetical protein DLM57_02985 [Pseudonocardiales bacterium]